MSTSKPQLLIAVPSLLCFNSLFEKTIDSVLEQLGNPDISLISDNAGKARNYIEAKGYIPQEVKAKSRIEAKTAVKKYSHIVVFWDGEELTHIIYFAKLNNLPLRIVPVQITKVRNKDAGQEFDVYIGRKTPWGNPFPIEHEFDGAKRKTVIDKFRVYFKEEFLDKPENLQKLITLRGLRLGCHCAPLECHGDVIANFLNDYFDSAENT